MSTRETSKEEKRSAETESKSILLRTEQLRAKPLTEQIAGLRLGQQLSTMSEPNYRCLSDRLNSFVPYPESSFHRPPQLASMGFWSSGRGEEVTCYGCGVSHTSFQPRQNIRRVHMQSSPGCPLNVGGDALQADDANAAENVVPPQDLPIPFPIGDRPIDDDLIRYCSFELQTNVTFNRSEPNFKLLDAEGIRLRRYTLFDWPGVYGNWKQLALLGFFYTGTLDMIQCCSCGIKYKARDLQTVPGLRQSVCPNSCMRYF